VGLGVKLSDEDIADFEKDVPMAPFLAFYIEVADW